MQVSEACASLSGWPQVSDELSVLADNLPNLGFFKQKQTSSSFSLLTKDTTVQDKEAASYKTWLLLINILKKLNYTLQKLSEVFWFCFFFF